MDKGYIKLFRKLQDNPLWTEKREYSKLECWLDILFEVRYKDEAKKEFIKMREITVNRGESIKSLETWSKRWGMTKSKARRVLNLFQKLNMIELKTEQKTTHLRVLKYSDYADWRNDNETILKLEEERDKENKEKKKELNTTKDELLVFIPEPLNTPDFIKTWKEWIKHRKEKRNKLTSTTAIKQINKFLKVGEKEAIAMIEKSIENGWTGLFNNKQQNNHITNQKQNTGLSAFKKAKENLK